MRYLIVFIAVLVGGCVGDPEPSSSATHCPLNGNDGATDGLSSLDGGAGICDKTCLKQAGHLCVKLAGSGRCVECTRDEHCAKHPHALGDRCDTTANICVCSSSSGCTGKTSGQRCASTLFLPMCACQSHADCVAPKKCVGQLFGMPVCQLPCLKDADCKVPFAGRCHTASGRCTGCLSDTDCASSPATPRCSVSLGRCVPCTADAHCTQTGLQRCDPVSGSCVACTADTHCTAAKNPAGNRCLAASLVARQCGCASDADCKGSVGGPTCHSATGRCSCSKNADCASPTTLCAAPFVGALYKACSKPCQAKTDCGHGLACLKPSGLCGECQRDGDCTLSSHSVCDTTTARCVACKTDAQCSGATPWCDSQSGRCVACRTNAHCSWSPNGTVCDGGICGCTSDANCSGKGSLGDRCVTYGGLRRCGCISDAQCKGSLLGDTCFRDLRQCGCASASECSTTSTGRTCRAPYPAAKHTQCLSPCTADTECTAQALPACNSQSGVCVGCTKDAHCAKNDWAKRCDTTTNRCVECSQSTQCTTTTLGKTCKNRLCVCKIAANCAANLHGKVCHAKLKVCSCVADTDCPTGKKCSPSTLGEKIKLCK